MRFVSAFLLAGVMGTSGALSDPQAVISAPSDGTGRGASRWLDLAATVSSFAPVRQLISTVGGSSDAISTGGDGRLTVLVLGLDARSGLGGRTDAIVIMSHKSGTNTINAASIPRDTGRVPKLSGGGYYSGKVNGLLRQFRQTMTLAKAMAELEKVIEKWLAIEIDYHVITAFTGFTNLVNEVGYVTVNVNKEIRDPKHIDAPGQMQGVYFPKRSSYQLKDLPLCNGLYRTQSNPIPEQYWCKRALPFMRSRKGPGNSDWVRSRRQQDFLGGAVRRVIQRGTGSLGSLVTRAAGERNGGRMYTNVPLSVTDATTLYNRLKNATLANQVVFKPTKYAARISGTSAYELKLSAVRQWTATYMR